MPAFAIPLISGLGIGAYFGLKTAEKSDPIENLTKLLITGGVLYVGWRLLKHV